MAHPPKVGEPKGQAQKVGGPDSPKAEEEEAHRLPPTEKASGWAFVRQQSRKLRGFSQLLRDEQRHELPDSSMTFPESAGPSSSAPALIRAARVAPVLPPSALPSSALPPSAAPAPLVAHRAPQPRLRREIREARIKSDYQTQLREQKLRQRRKDKRRQDLVAAYRARRDMEQARQAAEERKRLRQARRSAVEAHMARLAKQLSPVQISDAARTAERMQEARVIAANGLDAAIKEQRPGDDLWSKFGGERIAELLTDVCLVDARWLIELAELGGVLPRCQAVPPAARIGTDCLWRLRFAWDQSDCLAILVLSYGWLDASHPDKIGENLRRLAPVLRAMLRGCTSEHGTVGVMIE